MNVRLVMSVTFLLSIVFFSTHVSAANVIFKGGNINSESLNANNSVFSANWINTTHFISTDTAYSNTAGAFAHAHCFGGLGGAIIAGCITSENGFFQLLPFTSNGFDLVFGNTSLSYIWTRGNGNLHLNGLYNVALGDIIGTPHLNANDTAVTVYRNTTFKGLMKLESVPLPTCDSSKDGTIGYNGTAHYGCNNNVWRSLY